ncbi:UDP-N-acetylglucosamine 2-epimerase (non-hydrolyzing) [Sphingosinicella sp. LHD-64]|uniref:non-hydrolyzing UDP-N-acetylglucosamine 2-epimerase n=1 Tax=Sphingosinicella sp. LHD-64 TaxID=3072139 RepID=UPI00280E9F25|nr:UDP-N-acetylglucosamine 2-epimerase (non-hydrolyzing) [Sphingosinicella sp. LHD-64]MDQ8757262.1 UDP-N-acetylglucosamine 2-epimerase (non-hydrolyzing) [Sphingosinicella sp. LHD-64]
MRVLPVFGTRPEAVKMAPLVHEFCNNPDIETYICITAQHRNMLDIVLDFFGIKPDFDLDLMTPGQSLNQLLPRIVERFDEVLAIVAPDWVIVHGDTTTAFAATLAAHHRQIRVAHVEAGLRTYAPHPWPEESNRRGIATVADLHFAPTPGAAANLVAERVPGEVLVTGNTGVDALYIVLDRIGPSRCVGCGRKLVLVTGHRRESFGAPFEAICAALLDLATRPDVEIVYPVHPNPAVRGPVAAALGDRPAIHLIDPLDLPSFVDLMRAADLILTDSGGVQEEAATLGIPVLVMREVTERPEGIAAGVARLVGTDRNRIVEAANIWLDDPPALRPSTLYGDGLAAGRIADALCGLPVSPFSPGQVTPVPRSASAPLWTVPIS